MMDNTLTLLKEIKDGLAKMQEMDKEASERFDTVSAIAISLNDEREQTRLAIMEWAHGQTLLPSEWEDLRQIVDIGEYRP